MRTHPKFLRLGLLGYPLEHSLSPILHQAALHAAGLDGAYRLYPLPPLPEGEDALRELVHQLRAGDLHGLNVTIPHKQTVLKLLDELTPAARAIGAANTLLLDQGKVIGANTDVAGFLHDFAHLMDARPGRRALVLGAGGAARAVVYGLLGSGWQVIVAARRLEQAQILATEISVPGQSGQASPITLDTDALARVGQVDTLINTTPSGMSPRTSGCPWPEELPLPVGALVYDLVYNPSETRLLRRARESGLAARGGLGMLVEQAALSFSLWTGQPAPREAMWMQVEGVTE